MIKQRGTRLVRHRLSRLKEKEIVQQVLIDSPVRVDISRQKLERIRKIWLILLVRKTTKAKEINTLTTAE